jgi:hypothetical protein
MRTSSPPPSVKTATPDVAAIDLHVRTAVLDARLETEPAAHMIVHNLLPSELYSFLLATMPPPEGFDYANRHKQNFDPSLSTLAPEPSRAAWGWFESEVVGALLAPAIVERFQSSIEGWYRRLFDPAVVDAALALRQGAFRSRLMLRRPGYRLKPHRDTKISTITGLIYFARPGDSPDFGTELYRVDDDRLAPSMRTFYPEESGAHATMARTVPFIGNSALFFLNATGMAHGARIPRDSAQSERYAYQFYIGPSEPELARVVLAMDAEQQALWAGVGANSSPEY